MVLPKEIQSKLKEQIKQGDIPSLLTYLKGLEYESLESLVSTATEARYFQARTHAIREIIALYNN